MTKKIDQIKRLLRKHNYEVYVEINSASLCKIRSFFPERKEPPVLDFLSIVYSLEKEDSVSFTLNGENNDDIPCKKYIFDEVIFADIGRLCDFYGYSIELVGFYIDGEIADEKTFREFLLSSLKLNKKQTSFYLIQIQI